MLLKKIINLRRVVDIDPTGVFDDLMAATLVEKIRSHGLKVFVQIPPDTSVIERGFRTSPLSFADAAQSFEDPMTYATHREINELKRTGQVIEYGVKAVDVKFLELSEYQLSDIVFASETRVHWFTGSALRCEKTGLGSSPYGLTIGPSRLRCLRPKSDANEELKRRLWGGALKEEAAFTYPFRLHDVFVDELDIDLLRLTMAKSDDRDDPFQLYESAPAIYWTHQAAKKFNRELLNRSQRSRGTTKQKAVAWMGRMSPRSPLTTDYIARHVFNLINPEFAWGKGIKGHVAFSAEVLTDSKFIAQYKFEEFMGNGLDGLALVVMATHWFLERQKNFKQGIDRSPASRADLEKELKRLGFNGEEKIKSLCQIIMWAPENKAKKRRTPSERKPERLSRPRGKAKNEVAP